MCTGWGSILLQIREYECNFYHLKTFSSNVKLTLKSTIGLVIGQWAVKKL